MAKLPEKTAYLLKFLSAALTLLFHGYIKSCKKSGDRKQCPMIGARLSSSHFFKKGDKRQCGNYRVISLIDIAATVYVTLLLRRFQMARDLRTRPN